MPAPPPRPAQLSKLARDFTELTRKAINTWPEAKPWLEADDIARLLEKVGPPRWCRCCCCCCIGLPRDLRKGQLVVRGGSSLLACLELCVADLWPTAAKRLSLGCWPTERLHLSMRPTLTFSLVPAPQVDNFTSWLEEKEGEQAKRAPHEAPTYLSEEVSTLLLRLQKVGARAGWRGAGEAGGWHWQCAMPASVEAASSRPPMHPAGVRTRLLQDFNRLASKKKPRPPPPPPPPADANATDAEGEKAEADGEQAEGEGQEQQGEQQAEGKGEGQEQQQAEEQQAEEDAEEDKLDHDELR